MIERTPLSTREYSALQALFGMVSTFSAGLGNIRKRSEAAGCWEDMQTVEKLSSDILDTLLKTVPENKLRHIRKDLSNTRLYFKVEAPGLASMKDNQFSYTPTAVVNSLLNHLCQTECLLCNKTAVESRHCEWRKLIEDSLPNEINGNEHNSCKYSDIVLGLEEL